MRASFDHPREIRGTSREGTDGAAVDDEAQQGKQIQ